MPKKKKTIGEKMKDKKRRRHKNDSTVFSGNDKICREIW